MTFIFTPLEQAMLGEHVRYLEHGYTMCRKFSRAMENQVFIEKKALFEGFEQNIRRLQNTKKSHSLTFIRISSDLRVV